MIRRLVLALVVLVMTASAAAAHTRSQSFSTWEFVGTDAIGIFTVDARRATLLYALGGEDVALDERLSQHLTRTIGFEQNGAACDLAAPEVLPAAKGYLRQRLVFACPGDIGEGSARLTIGAFFPVSASHLHILHVIDSNGASIERVLNDASRTIAFERGSASEPAWSAFILLGFEHVLSGLDHMAFLAALLLLCARLKDVLFIVTAFTIGHSLSLALVALGYLQPIGAAIEAMIGISIALAAQEAIAGRWGMPRIVPALWAAGLGALALWNWLWGPSLVPATVFLGLAVYVFLSERDDSGWGHALRRGTALAALFGLVHGAGFAGALLDLDLPRENLLIALLSFNIGVELGQIAAVTPVWLIAIYIGHEIKRRAPYTEAWIAAGLMALGTFWFVERSLAF